MKQFKFLLFLFCFFFSNFSLSSAPTHEGVNKRERDKMLFKAFGIGLKHFFKGRTEENLFPNKKSEWNHMMGVAVRTLREVGSKHSESIEDLQTITSVGLPKAFARLFSGVRRSHVRLFKGTLPLSSKGQESFYPYHISAEWYVPMGDHDERFPGIDKYNFEKTLLESDESILLYLHGGAMCLCSPKTHREMLLRLAKETGKIIVAVAYRKPPTYSYPTPLLDCYKTYEWLLSQGKTVSVAGDSAGGTLALSLTKMAKKEGLALPKSLVLVSPWVNLAENEVVAPPESSLRKYSSVDFLPAASLGLFAKSYAGKNGVAELSPINFDLKIFPPMLMLTGEYEMLYDQQVSFAKKVKNQGIFCKSIVASGMVHVYPLFAPLKVRQARQAFIYINDFLRRQENEHTL